ncbi:MAG TPA: hypothetical protein DDY88_08350 [Actinobacteria bacterium]|nr:hypothetical protein [Actinomycetota bacterium]
MQPEVQARSAVRAEHPSVGQYAHSVLSNAQREHVLLISFSQWDFAQAALADIALSFREMGSQTTLALWANDTPVHDVGWAGSRLMSRLLLSATSDDRLEQALLSMGMDQHAFARPPIRRWKPREPLQLPALLNRSSIRAMSYQGTAVGRAILQVHPDDETPVSDDFIWPKRWVEACARSYAFVLDQTLALIDERGITAIVIYNGRFLHDRAASAAAEMRGLPILNYDTGGHDTDFDLTIDATHDWDALQTRMLEMYERWPAHERDVIGSSWFLERVNHEDPGNAIFVEMQEQGRLTELPAAEVSVVYFSSSGDEIAELELDWDAYFAGQEHALAVLADECRRRPGYSLVVRSHPHKRLKPKQDLAEWMAAVDRAQPDLHLDPYSVADSYQLMRQADVVVTYGSTAGVEAAFAHKPVVVMGPCAYDKLGCAVGVSTVQELAMALDAPAAGSWSGAVSYGLMMKRRGFTYAFVERQASWVCTLGGVALREPSKLVLDSSHLINRFEKWRLTRR